MTTDLTPAAPERRTMSLLGLGMLRAGVLPRTAVALCTMSPVVAIVVVMGMSAGGLDAGPWFLTLLAPVAIGYMWLGWVMAREPALDVRSHRENGPFASA